MVARGGNDTLKGEAGNDVLIGRAGADVLTRPGTDRAQSITMRPPGLLADCQFCGSANTGFAAGDS